jgi:hypothetical protein
MSAPFREMRTGKPFHLDSAPSLCSVAIVETRLPSRRVGRDLARQERLPGHRVDDLAPQQTTAAGQPFEDCSSLAVGCPGMSLVPSAGINA